MAWHGQEPPATDILAHFQIPGTMNYFEVDKVGEKYRLCSGNLFGFEEIAIKGDLEALLRATRIIQDKGVKRGKQEFIDALERIA